MGLNSCRLEPKCSPIETSLGESNPDISFKGNYFVFKEFERVLIPAANQGVDTIILIDNFGSFKDWRYSKCSYKW